MLIVISGGVISTLLLYLWSSGRVERRDAATTQHKKLASAEVREMVHDKDHLRSVELNDAQNRRLLSLLTGHFEEWPSGAVPEGVHKLQIAHMALKHGGSVYGGLVRDYVINGRKPKDVDVKMPAKAKVGALRLKEGSQGCLDLFDSIKQLPNFEELERCPFLLSCVACHRM